MKGITNAQKDVSNLATKGELAQKADQSALDSTNTEVAKKANQSDLTALQTTVEGKQDKLTAGANITISGNTISASGGTITAGEGISVSGTQVSLKSIGTSKSAGSGTSVPVVSIDAYGRVTSLSSTTIYPPTTAGTAGQVWTSDGNGAGSWQTPNSYPIISNVSVTGDLISYDLHNLPSGVTATVKGYWKYITTSSGISGAGFSKGNHVTSVSTETIKTTKTYIVAEIPNSTLANGRFGFVDLDKPMSYKLSPSTVTITLSNGDSVNATAYYDS